MKKFVILISLMFIFLSDYAQFDNTKLIGEWLKIKSEDLEGNKLENKIDESDKYLRFSFYDDFLVISESPYNYGFKLLCKLIYDTIKTSYIDPFFEAPGPYFHIESLSEEELILKTEVENTGIRYFFQNQKLFQAHVVENETTFDNDTILLITNRKYLSSNVFFISNDIEANLIERPKFNSPMEFGYYLCEGLAMRKYLTDDVISEPIKISFVINSFGKVSNIEVIESFSEYYSEKIVKLISKTNKKWIPICPENNDLSVKMIFTFKLLSSTMKINLF